jgi:hypothetical protein
MTPVLNAPTITIEQVNNLYIGKGHCCRCGCGGNYYDVKADASHAKKIQHYLKKFASGKYSVTEQAGLGDEHLYEINLSRSGNTDRVATIYIKK